MINTTVIFGNNNRYNVQINTNLVCGDLIYILPLGINKTYLDVMYCICNGKLITVDDLNIPVLYFNVIDNEATIHFIFKKTPTAYQDKFLSTKYQAWVEAKYNMRVTNHGLLETLRATLVNLVDVIVTIPERELQNYIEIATDVENESCVICSADLHSAATECQRVKKCGHCFHTACITHWLTTASVKCPMCNIDVRTFGTGN